MKKEYVIIGAVVLTIGYFVWRNNRKNNTQSLSLNGRFPEKIILDKIKWGNGVVISGSYDKYTILPIIDPTSPSRNLLSVSDGMSGGGNAIYDAKTGLLIGSISFNVMLGQQEFNYFNQKENEATKNGFPFALDLTKVVHNTTQRGNSHEDYYTYNNQESLGYNKTDNTFSIVKAISSGERNYDSCPQTFTQTNGTSIYNANDGSFIKLIKSTTTNNVYEDCNDFGCIPINCGDNFYTE